MRASDDAVGKNVAVLPGRKPLDTRPVPCAARVGDVEGAIDIRDYRRRVLDLRVRTLQRMYQLVTKVAPRVSPDIAVFVRNEHFAAQIHGDVDRLVGWVFPDGAQW